MVGISLKLVGVIVGIVLTVVGISTNQWKVAAIGNAVGLASLLLI